MYVAIDETGSFREGKDLEYGIVTLVTVTDKEWSKFRLFIDNLYPSGWNNIKGTTIDDDNREKIVKYIGMKHEIKYTSLLFDLTFGTDDSIEYQRNGQIQKIKDSIASLIASKGHKSLIEEMELMAKRFCRMSKADFSKFILIYELYREWMQYYQYDFIHIYRNNDSWDLNHIIDNQSRAGNFKTILNEMLILTTNHLSPEFKIFSPVELKDTNHPFEIKHSTIFEGKNVIDGHKIFKNMRISNEQDDPVLLLPDLIGNTIHRSIKFRHQKKWLKILKRLISNRSLTMNNKFRRGKNNYYLIRGFDRTLDQSDPSSILREHHTLMSGI